MMVILVLIVMVAVGAALIHIDSIERWVKDQLKDEPDPTEAKQQVASVVDIHEGK